MSFLRRLNRKAAMMEIREFVYLDEISVESLLASSDGEILVESTNTKSSSIEVGGSGSADLFKKASFAPSLKASRGKAVQELRKSVAQSAFARFRERNQTHFTIRPLDSMKPRRKDPARLLALDRKTLRRLRQGVPLSSLSRGDLLEIETNISAADSYKARTAMTAVTDVIEAYPSFLTIEQRDALKSARPLTELIDKLNGDAIPVIGEFSSLRINVLDGEPWLLQSARTPSNESSSLLLESVVQPNWFWGDIGRTLFQNRRFRILCRVVSPDLRSTPGSSYVGTILRTIDPRLAETIDDMGPMFLGALRSGTSQGHKNRDTPSASADLVAWYVNELKVLGHPDLSAGASIGLGGFEAVPVRSLQFSAQTEFFLSLDQALELTATTISLDQRAGLRDRARTEFGLWPWSAATTVQTTSSHEGESHQYLEIEIVAAYW
jgi:hypothetical protein